MDHEAAGKALGLLLLCSAMPFAAINAHLDSPNSVKRLCTQFQGSRITTEQIKRICQIGPFLNDLDFEGVKYLCAACLASRLLID